MQTFNFSTNTREIRQIFYEIAQVIPNWADVKFVNIKFRYCQQISIQYEISDDFVFNPNTFIQVLESYSFYKSYDCFSEIQIERVGMDLKVTKYLT